MQDNRSLETFLFQLLTCLHIRSDRVTTALVFTLRKHSNLLITTSIAPIFASSKFV